MPTGLNDLPEPADLHARLSARRPLDWGDPIPSKAELAAEYGVRKATESLQLLTKAAAVEERITDAMITSIGDEAAPYHLANRVKSPHSLARKLATLEDYYRRTQQVPEDVLRYTAAVKHPDELTEAAVRTIDRLNDRGTGRWSLPTIRTSMAAATRDCTPSCTATVNASSFRCTRASPST